MHTILQIQEFTKAPSYDVFKKRVRALRDEGFTIQPTRQGGYLISRSDDQDFSLTVQYPLAPTPKSEAERDTVYAKNVEKEADRKAKALARAKGRRPNKDKEVLPRLEAPEALAWLDRLGLTMEVNPPVGSTHEAMAWDLRALAASNPEAETDQIKSLLLDRYQYRFPSARLEDLRFVLFRDSPTGVPFPLPMLGVDFSSRAAASAADARRRALAAQIEDSQLEEQQHV